MTVCGGDGAERDPGGRGSVMESLKSSEGDRRFTQERKVDLIEVSVRGKLGFGEPSQ